MISNPSIMQDYNAIGLIGGEFFDNQINLNISEYWYELIHLLHSLLKQEKIKEIWIASALLCKCQLDLANCIAILYDKYQDNQCVRICTSYDTIGRFKDKEKEQIWLDNLKFIKCNFPRIDIHTQTILTQDTIEKFINNPNYFDFINEYSSIDFRYPSISRKDCPTATGIKDYRGMMLKRLNQFPTKFFIEDRNLFLKFLRKFYEKYGIIKVQNLIHQPEMRSRHLKIYVENTEIEDRWNDTRDVYLPCGHLVDGLCYVNDDKHCIYCDIEKFIKNINNLE